MLPLFYLFRIVIFFFFLSDQVCANQRQQLQETHLILNIINCLLFVAVNLKMSGSSSTSATILAGILTNATMIASTENNPQVHVASSEPIFLQTKLAQGVAGTFVWAALFLTCQQVSCAKFNFQMIFISFLFLLDIPPFEMVYKSCRTKMDCQDFVYCTYLCNIFLDQPSFLQFRKLLCIFLHST